MAFENMKVDLTLIPDSYTKELFVDFAKKYNAVVDGVSESRQELDQLSGTTPDEKLATYTLMGKVRKIFSFIHGKRFNTTLFTIFIYFVISIFKQVGLNPDQMGRLFDVAIKLLEKFANQ